MMNSRASDPRPPTARAHVLRSAFRAGQEEGFSPKKSRALNPEPLINPASYHRQDAEPVQPLVWRQGRGRASLCQFCFAVYGRDKQSTNIARNAALGLQASHRPPHDNSLNLHYNTSTQWPVRKSHFCPGS